MNGVALINVTVVAVVNVIVAANSGSISSPPTWPYPPTSPRPSASARRTAALPGSPSPGDRRNNPARRVSSSASAAARPCCSIESLEGPPKWPDSSMSMVHQNRAEALAPCRLFCPTGATSRRSRRRRQTTACTRDHTAPSRVSHPGTAPGAVVRHSLYAEAPAARSALLRVAVDFVTLRCGGQAWQGVTRPRTEDAERALVR